MNKLATFELLCHELIDGTLSDDQQTQLCAQMSEDKELRRFYRRFMAMHASLQWDYAAVANHHVASAQRSADEGASEQRGRWWPLVAAALFLIAIISGISYQVMSTAHMQPIMMVDVQNGTALWTSGSEQQRTLKSGDVIRAGSLSLSGTGAKATLRFSDQTTIAIIGDTTVSIIDDGQKHIHVQRGLLTAHVMPQEKNKPLEIKTETAAIEVRGTRLSVQVRDDSTALEVDEGQVRMVRLADGQVVDVATQQIATATLLTTTPFVAHARPPLPTQWQYDGSSPLPSPSKGTWHAASGQNPGYVSAEPYVAGRRADDSLIIHHGVRVHSLDGLGKPFVALTEHSKIRLVYRFTSTRKQAMKLFLSTALPKGGFGGNFETTINTDTPADEHGWKIATITVKDIPALVHDHPTPVGRYVSVLLPYCFSAEAGLHISAIEISESH